ncbi:glutamine--fructose-6-phosphate transaminase (isomerizing) [Patescibacteria group bacterium]|nr:glutamine--fructose-6-phosphate transaminase (isomerizing) [Patescibacteria group bacterium]
MCGIFAYKGKARKLFPQFLCDGLLKLEYRGYDSSGIAFVSNQKIHIYKEIGEVKNLQKLVFKNDLSSKVGIGHTRWATHGRVTKKNAHPHLDCNKDIAVVHNGIIENFEIIKKDLIKKGHKLISQTDTEVIPHLIEEENKKNKNFTESAFKTFQKIQGLNAFVAINSKDEIVAFKNGSPLVAGILKEGYLITSDIPTISEYTDRLILIKDNEGIVIKDNNIFKIKDGKIKKAKVSNIKIQKETSDKGKFKHFLIKEIYEEPDVIKRIAQNSTEEITEASDLIKKAVGTYFSACGTASHAGIAATYLFSKIAKKHVNFSVSSEFEYFQHFLIPQSLLIAASQSGETIDTLEAIKAAKKHKSKILALVNVPGSSIERISDFSIHLNAGPEKSVLSTKSYIAKLSIFLLLAYKVADKYKVGQKLLLETSNKIRFFYKKEYIQKIKLLAKKLKNQKHIYVIGRGLNYATALEAALKIKESSYIHAEGFAGGELKHGVIALVEEKTPCIAIVANDDSKNAILSNTQELKARGAYIIGISPINEKVFDYWLKVPDLKEASVIANIIPIQFLAYYLTLEKGLNPDKPRNLAKSVTVK